LTAKIETFQTVNCALAQDDGREAIFPILGLAQALRIIPREMWPDGGLFQALFSDW
jgi:hypothetical protein